MSQAIAQPLPSRKAKGSKKYFESEDHAPAQHAAVEIPGLGDPLEHESTVQVVETELTMDSIALLAFNEEPLRILIHRSAEKFSPRTTDYIAINNIKAEMLFKNGWVQMGYLPRGEEIITKRKYVQAMALAKIDHLTTRIEDRDTEKPRNFADRLTVASCSFTILEDRNPRGAAWLAELLRR